MSVDTEQHVSRSLRLRGAMVLAPFALLWALVAVSGLPAGAAWPARGAALLVAVGLVLLALRPPTGGPERVRDQPADWHRQVGRVNLGELLAIVVVVALGAGTGHPQLVPPLVCLVVGLHFVPLARLFDQPQYRATAAGLVVGAVAGLAVLLLGDSQEASRVVVGTVAAVTLWATSAALSTHS